MKILLVEDDLKIASFIKKGFQEGGFSVDHVENGEDALHMAGILSYDTIVLDLMLPKLDGLSVIDRLRRNGIITPIIILSAKRSVEDRVKGFQRGSDDYLTKPFAFSELLARVQALIRRNSGSAITTTLKVSDLTMNLLSHEVERDGSKIELQPLEFALLEYLMRNKGRVVSKTMIMEHVWDYNFDPNSNIVEARICKLRDKIDKQFSKKIIQTVRGVGYVLK